MERSANRIPKQGTVEWRLWCFARLANQSAPHPRDWKRFYEFISYAHARRAGLTADEVEHKLQSWGFDERHSNDFALAYWHGRCVLHARTAANPTQSHAGWLRRGGTHWS